MKRGRASGQTPQSNKKQRTDQDANDKETTAAQEEKEASSPQKKGASKLPPLTEEQIKARFEGMTTRHKRTPSKKQLESSKEEKKPAPSTPKAVKTASTIKTNIPKIPTPKTAELEQTDSGSSVKRGRGRPPKQIGSKDSPKASPVAKVKPPEQNTAITRTAAIASTTKKDSPNSLSSPAKVKPPERNTTIATTALTTKKKHEPSVTPVRSEKEPVKKVNVPISESSEQRSPTSVVEEEIPVTYITIPEDEPPRVKQQRKLETDQKAKAFVEKLKSRLGISEAAVVKPPVPVPAVPTALPATSSAPVLPTVLDTDTSDVAADVPSPVETSPPSISVAPAAPSAPVPAASSESPYKEDKETTKSSKPAQKDASQAPVTVNIVLKDQSCLPFMTDVGMHILYYCKHCTHYSQQLLSVIEHIKQCPRKGCEDSNTSGGTEDEVAEYLESVALDEIKEERKAARKLDQDITPTEAAQSVKNGKEQEDADEIEVELEAETLTPQESDRDGKEEEEQEEDETNQDDDDDEDDDEDWKPHPVKKIPAVLLEETEEDRLQKECDICRKPVFSFIMRRHMEMHARKAAENAAREKAKAIALGLDAVPDTTGSVDPSGKDTVEDAEETPIDTETHLTVDTSIIKGTVEVIESTSAAAIAVPVQADVQTSHQIEADVPREVTISIKEVDPDDISLAQVENGYSADTEKNNEDQTEKEFVVPKTIPKGLALKKTLYPCKLHELYFVSHEALTEHFMSAHWGTEIESELRATHVKRGRGRPRGSVGRSRGAGGTMKVSSARPGITPDEEAAAVAMSVMRHSKLGWSRQKVNPGRSGPIKCQICYKKFATPFRLDMHHARAHTAEKMKPIPCQVCGKMFRNQVQRRNHFRIVHEGKKRIQSKSAFRNREKKLFICDLCGYSTPDNSRLKNHIMSVHQGIMPYACDQCDYKCNEKSDIVRHKHKHLGIKRYSCEYCSYRADQRWLLVNHTAKQHGIQLPRVSRNTRGSYFSMRNKKRRETLQHQINPLQWLLQQNPDIQIQEQKGGEHDEAMTEAAHAVLELGDVATDGEEQVTVYIEEVMEDGGSDTMQAYTEGQEISVEELQQVVHESKPGEVMYVREDGTVIEPEEAALLLMSVNAPGSNIQIEEVQQMSASPAIVQVSEVSAPSVQEVQQEVNTPGVTIQVEEVALHGQENEIVAENVVQEEELLVPIP